MHFNNNPLVSVIVPTYNRAQLLPRAIKSVLNQTYPNFELIIVDDGSTDDTEKIVKSFNDSRIIYYKHKENKGALSAQNTGFRIMKGKYVCQFGSDDELFPDALQTVVDKFIELSPKGVGFLRFDVVNEKGNFTGFGIREEGYVSYEDVLCNKFRGDYWAARDAELLKNNVFDERLDGGGGVILWLKLHRITKVYYVPKVLARAYTEHGEERMSKPKISTLLKNIPRISLTEEVFLEEFGEEIRNICPRYYGQKLASQGLWQILNGEKHKGRKTLFQSFRYNFSLKHFIVYFLSYLFSKNQLTSLFAIYYNLQNYKQYFVKT